MTLLFVSQFAIGAGPLAYAMLLVATTSLGIGFGLAVPSLNTFAAAFFPDGPTARCWYLNALLGWARRWRRCWSRSSWGWGSGRACRVLVAVVLAGLLLFSARPPARRPRSAAAAARGRGLAHPARVLDLRRVRGAATASWRR